MVGIVKVHDLPPKNYAPKADLQNHLGDSAVLYYKSEARFRLQNGTKCIL